MNCDTLVHNNETALVFSIDSTPVSESGSFDVFSARNTIWGPNGLSRAFDSISLDHIPDSVQRGDIVEKIGSSTRYTTRLQSPMDSRVADAPKVAYFVKKGSDSVSDLSTSDAKQLLLSNPNLIVSPAINKEEFAGKLEELFKSNNTKCFQINTSNPTQAIQNALSGTKQKQQPNTESKPQSKQPRQRGGRKSKN